MQQNLSLTISLLSRTPAALDSFLRDLPDAWTSNNEGENTWSPFDILGHLIHGERTDWMPRVKMILQHGEAKTFEPFDRLAQQHVAKPQSLARLLDEFARLRSDSLNALRSLSLTPQDLERCGKHPRFGTVTLSQLLATWAAHDLTHLHQLSRVMAHQYREAVGPWIAFLGVLHCDSHSSA